jgi:alpha-N-arabinofuranosidase
MINGKGLLSSLNDTIIKRPTYNVFQLYSNFMGDIALDTFVDTASSNIYIDSPAYNTNKYINVPDIDAIASYSEDFKKLYLAVVNRNKEKVDKCRVQIDNFVINAAKVHEICSNGSECFNDLHKSDEVYLRDTVLKIDGNNFIYDFLPHSISILELDIE